MTIKYSASAGGFFDTKLHREIPDDAVTVCPKRYAELFAGQADGQEIILGHRGRPVLQKPAPSTIEAARAAQLKAVKREAAIRIEQRMPVWKQINALRDRSDPGFFEVDAIRAASNVIEQALSDLTTHDQIIRFSVSDNPIWPEFN